MLLGRGTAEEGHDWNPPEKRLTPRMSPHALEAVGWSLRHDASLQNGSPFERNFWKTNFDRVLSAAGWGKGNQCLLERTLLGGLKTGWLARIFALERENNFIGTQQKVQ